MYAINYYDFCCFGLDFDEDIYQSITYIDALFV